MPVVGSDENVLSLLGRACCPKVGGRPTFDPKDCPDSLGHEPIADMEGLSVNAGVDAELELPSPALLSSQKYPGRGLCR